MKTQEGRYLKLKIKSKKENTELTISNIYLEPDKQNSVEELIPEGVRNSDYVGGDFLNIHFLLNYIILLFYFT